MDGGVMTGKVALMTASSRVIGAGGGLCARLAACLPAGPRWGRPVPGPDRLRVRGPGIMSAYPGFLGTGSR